MCLPGSSLSGVKTGERSPPPSNPPIRRKNAEVAVATAPEEVDDVDALLKEPEPQRTHPGGGGEIGWFKLPPALGMSP